MQNQESTGLPTMERRIGIRSDEDTLKSLHSWAKKKYIKFQIRTNKDWIAYFFVCALSVIVTLYLTDYTPNLIGITIIATFGTLICFMIVMFNLIKMLFLIIKYNSKFRDFVKRHDKFPVIHYVLGEDTLIHEGPTTETYKWTEFKKIVYDKEEFWLISDKVERNIWIPKITMVDPVDYDFFFQFAESKIKPVDHAV
jgi:hypothetical protein